MKQSILRLALGIILLVSCRASQEKVTDVDTYTQAAVLTEMPPKTQLPNPCASEDIHEFIIRMDDIEKRFDDLTLKAEETSPENLLPILEEMTAIEQEFKDMDVPPCALRTKAAFESYLFSKSQCYFQIFAAEGLGYTKPPEIPEDHDFCEAALDHFDYYELQRGALGD